MTLTYEDRRRARLMDQIRTMALGDTTAIEGARLADQLTGPRLRHTWDAEQEPIYAHLVAELGAPAQDHVGAGPVIVGELATQQIDMTALLAEECPPATVLAPAGQVA